MKHQALEYSEEPLKYFIEISWTQTETLSIATPDNERADAIKNRGGNTVLTKDLKKCLKPEDIKLHREILSHTQ